VSCKTNYTRIGDKNANYIPYYLKVYEADSLYIVGEYESSFQILSQLFKNYEPINISGYYEYKTYIASSIGSNKELKKGKVNDLIAKYGMTKSIIDVDTILKKIIKKYDLSDNKINKLKTKYLKTINIGLREEIKTMVKDDQLYRGKNANYELMLKTDSINKQKLINIFNKYGYPTEKLIGNYYIDDSHIDIGAILLHTGIDFQENYLLPLLFNYTKIGKCNPSRYATVYDRMLLSKSNFQGKQKFGEIKNKSMKVININNIDSIRRSIGLPHINYNLWQYKKLYGNLNQKNINP